MSFDVSVSWLNHFDAYRAKYVSAENAKWLYIYFVTLTNTKHSMKQLGIFNSWPEPHLCKTVTDIMTAIILTLGKLHGKKEA